MTTDTAIAITKASTSRVNEVNLDDPGFGRVLSDHMLEIRYEGGKWHQAEIKPYGKIEVTPALNTLHYAQSVFEGMKGYYVDEETVNLFRPEKNWQRMSNSCERLCIPFIDQEIFIQGITELIKLDHKWVPRKDGNSLYIRPLACAFDHVIAAKASANYRFFVITSPAGSYYNKPVKLISSQKYVRAVKGGVGYA
ncbi:MAG TPA: hypothetical protein VJ964_11775, partial [Balneolaceae bacterium]|nr:hypothetical protein [Balneolaceae bacterium]